ncbi:protein-glutamine gamma-glutamyltransferase [Gorillibacterium sp. sgz5001074]|uniref:protein-glutamine gamma-glutamyltransferase n=1 Tax=Gorillibacterium sp. sgz5001074 TaxID=3446695 RepID=UPI003F6759AF
MNGEIQQSPPVGAGEKEVELFRTMRDGSITYAYRSAGELLFELQTRVRLTEAAKALNESGVQFAVYRDSRCNEKLWRRTEQGGFLLLPGTEPAQGIRNIFEEGSLYAFECATAMVIVLYKGMLDVLGDALFNLWFGGILLYDWHYDKDLRLVDSKRPEEALPGDVQYFKNPDVAEDFPEWQGENVLRLEPDLFYGHGLGIKPAERIIESLNRKRKPGSQVSAYLTDVVVHPDYPVLYRTLIGAGAAPGVNPVPPGAGTRTAGEREGWESGEIVCYARIGAKYTRMWA